MKTRGFTLIELLVVLGILAALAGIVIPLIDGIYNKNDGLPTRATLVEIRDAIFGKRNQAGYVTDMGAMPLHLHDLMSNDQLLTKKVFDINTRIGWCGPYLRSMNALHFDTTTNSYKSTPFYFVDNANNFTTNYCYSSGNDVVIVDEWSHPVVLQYVTVPNGKFFARLISAGANGKIDTLPTQTQTDIDNSTNNDDIILNLTKATN